jgi:regulator of protease activity HflC (stomatin/prohibitin superfamily)
VRISSARRSKAALRLSFAFRALCEELPVLPQQPFTPKEHSMNERLSQIAETIRNAWQGVRIAPQRGTVVMVATLCIAALGAWTLVQHPPVHTVAPGEVAVRTNQLTGAQSQFRDGPMWVLPALHSVRSLNLRDQTFRPAQGRSADGEAPFQSVEGLSLGVDLAVRYAIDPAQTAKVARALPDDLGSDVVEPAVQGVVYRVFSRYTVREIFSSKRAEIQQTIEGELKVKFAADGLLLKGVQIGKVDLPADYRTRMEGLLAEELASEKMRYTLELKSKLVKQTELEAQAQKVQRETAAAAAAAEQVIAAKGQEEAMRHVLPFKQKQIEQRQLEAEANKVTRLKQAEGEAQARKIEAEGEAHARNKLAESEAWRQERLGQVASAQMARDGELITRHPLLIQKAMADKLSDKIQVIIAPPNTGNGFIAAGLLGNQTAKSTAAASEDGVQ